MSSCELNLGDQYMLCVCVCVCLCVCVSVCMYVYGDSNFGFFRIPHVYVYAHKWLEHQILCKSLPVSNFTLCYTLLCRNFYQRMGVFCTFFFSIKVR